MAHETPPKTSSFSKNISNILSDREKQILSKFKSGACTKQVAADLGLSLPTVYSYCGRVCAKLGLNGLTDLILYAVRDAPDMTVFEHPGSGEGR